VISVLHGKINLSSCSKFAILQFEVSVNNAIGRCRSYTQITLLFIFAIFLKKGLNSRLNS